MKQKEQGPFPSLNEPSSASRNPELRLIIIPFAIYVAWVLDIFLLEGRARLFSHADPTGLLLYTIVSCIVIGTVVPVLWIRVSFMSGVVNIFQIGFRSLRRTLAACSCTILAGFVTIVILEPFGQDRMAFLNAFLLLLPTGIAAVMICWTLLGTHVQAYVRAGGALISIHVGVAVTTIAFALMALAFAPVGSVRDALVWFACIGILSALFFFAVRDIYATTIVVTGLLVLFMQEQIDTVYLTTQSAAVYASAVTATGALVLLHGYFSRHFTTILVPVRPGNP